MNKRFSAFLSYSQKDEEPANRVYRWLTDFAGLPIWRDRESLKSGKISSKIKEALPLCQNFVALISESWSESEWCPGEWADAVKYRNANSSFELIAIRIDDSDLPTNVQGYKFLNAPGGAIALDDAVRLLSILTDANYDEQIARRKDVYIARPWPSKDGSFRPGIGLSDFVLRKLDSAGFRAIGDAEDQPHFSEATRVETIMRSCGAFVAVLPNRGNGQSSKYILRELALARKLKLPVLSIADRDAAALHKETDVNSADETVIPKLEVESGRMLHVGQAGFDEPTVEADPTFAAELSLALEDLFEEWIRPEKPYQIFLASSLNKDWDVPKIAGAQLISNTIACPCIIGDGIKYGEAQKQIVNHIKNSIAVIADISGENLNTCIEAGIARGAGTRLHLIAKGERRRPDIFMFRDYEVEPYADEMEYLGVLHRIARAYRRSVVTLPLK